MPTLTLLRQGSELAKPSEQRRILAQVESCPEFEVSLNAHRCGTLEAGSISTLQVNVGRLCNQTCAHCHVDAGPDRREDMAIEVAEACIRALNHDSIQTLDITGGAPEMSKSFRYLVQEARRLDKHIIDRCNLTILVANGYSDLPEFLAEHQVEVIASLPCYLEENTDAQRGKGVYARSIEGLKRLNTLGYGQPDSGLDLTLVYNPVGHSLPGDQSQLEAAYREQLRARHGIEFTRLFTITNLPISRFLEDLLNQNQLEAYMEKLVQAFNPNTIDGLMCRNTLSVDWQGFVYDCDFNQMLDLKVAGKVPRHINEFDADSYSGRAVVTGRHCYGCTAGAGSGCTGAIL